MRPLTGQCERQRPPLEPFQLADDLFLVLLDDRTGRHVAHPAAVATGLAGALLLELVGLGCVSVVGDRLRRADMPAPDETTRVLAGVVEAEPQHSLPTWLAYVATHVVATVADRLVAAGRVVRARGSRSLRGAPDRYMPVRADAVAFRAVRLARLVQAGAVDGLYDGVLVALCDAIGFMGHLWRDVDEPNTAHRDWVLAKIAEQRPDVRQVVACVAAAAGAQTFRR